MTETAQPVIARYFTAADSADWIALASCFTEDAIVHDDGGTHVGREEIVAWRTAVATAFTWTTTLLGVESTGDDAYTVSVHLEGDFPGGVVDLQQRFRTRDGLIAELDIRP